MSFSDTVALGDRRWRGDELPLVSVFSWVYNHASYLRRSIESILQQRTNFVVEVIIHDDASTDGGTAIIQEYDRGHPGLFRNVLRSENVYSAGGCIVTPLLTLPRGRFVALTHGDDYWNYPRKLQRQVELLLANPAAAGCFHAADDLNELTGENSPGLWRPPEYREAYGIDDLFKWGNFTTTASVMYRREVLPDRFDHFRRVTHADFMLLMHALKHGSMLYIDEVMSAYRRHAGGVHTSTYGVVSALKALHALVEGAAACDLEKHPGYLESVRWRLAEALSAHAEQKAELESVRLQLQQAISKYASFRKSRSVAFMMELDKRVKQLARRFRNLRGAG